MGDSELDFVKQDKAIMPYYYFLAAHIRLDVSECACVRACKQSSKKILKTLKVVFSIKVFDDNFKLGRFCIASLGYIDLKIGFLDWKFILMLTPYIYIYL